MYSPMSDIVVKEVMMPLYNTVVRNDTDLTFHVLNRS